MQYPLLSQAVKKLLVLWLSFLVFIFIILLVQTYGGKYGKQSYSAWFWFSGFVLAPVLILFWGYAKASPLMNFILKGTNLFLFKSAIVLSAMYLLVLLSVLFVQPFNSASDNEVKNLHSTDAALIIFQVLIDALLIVLFVTIFRKEKEFAGGVNVFISYNHRDRLVAENLKALFVKNKIPVTIDSDNMNAGDNIENFIKQSIANSLATVLIVSRNSLLSEWVGIETINAFFFEQYSSSRKFIACYIDNDFLNLQFTSDAIRTFDKRINEIDDIIRDRMLLNADTNDVNGQKTRLKDIRHNIDKIVQRLKNSLCIDISTDELLKKNSSLILKSIYN